MAAIDQTIDIGDLQKPWYQRLFEIARRQPLGTAGGLVVLLMVLAAIFANFLSPYDPEAASWKNQLSPPDAEYWLGTDAFGRDILTRIIFWCPDSAFCRFYCCLCWCYQRSCPGCCQRLLRGQI